MIERLPLRSLTRLLLLRLLLLLSAAALLPPLPLLTLLQGQGRLRWLSLRQGTVSRSAIADESGTSLTRVI